MNDTQKTRREFLEATSRGVATGLAASATLGAGSLNALARTQEPKGEKDNYRSPKFPYGKAEHCIMIWLGGGASHLDTWDPKQLGDPKKKKAGSAYESIPTAIKDVRVCKHLSRCAPIMDRFNPIRSVHHNVIDEHAAAVKQLFHLPFETSASRQTKPQLSARRFAKRRLRIVGVRHRAGDLLPIRGHAHEHGRLDRAQIG